MTRARIWKGPLPAGHTAEAPPVVWAGWRVQVGFPADVLPRREVRNEWNIAESSHRPGPETPMCRKKPGGWRGWGALDSEINSGVIHMEESGVWSVWWSGA